MDEARLSPRERRILAEIEQGLGADRSLARGLRSGRPRHRPRIRLLGGRATLLLGAVALGLFVAAVATESPPLIWAFAVVWVVTLVCGLRLLLRWSRRHLTGAERPRPDEPDR
ncbi:DUF3040 domain-containing protein [Streptomyces showdoensis]|uniref:DUF3040 domain-containing protein n=1 Tax=Streptomyces showdoensis TaxID=68268 RepID=A0A2P2GC79_STREW|nr:DUF3040 domain-containing protein [Streptomyces showdoensis]KKZ69034.1 hypothetical protein VO63_36400 [Streptomyces showdoensis]